MLNDRKGFSYRFFDVKFSDFFIKKFVNYKVRYKCSDVLLFFFIGFCLFGNGLFVVFLFVL